MNDRSRYILDQEANEQQKVVREGRLPKKTNGVPHDILRQGMNDSMEYEDRKRISDKNNQEYTKAQYETMGIKVLEEYDDLFYSVELPKGWEIRPTDHTMWNDVVDDRGRKRISFFYKGAFYDRDAFSNFMCRYSFSITPFDDYEDRNVTYEDRKFKPWTLWITDCENKILELDSIQADNDQDYYKIDDTLREKGREYLNAHYPMWQDINAYWSETEG